MDGNNDTMMKEKRVDGMGSEKPGVFERVGVDVDRTRTNGVKGKMLNVVRVG